MDDQKRKNLIGERIKERRLALGLSQEDLQKKTKIKNTMISNFENGKREPNLANIAKIAHALDTTIDKLYFGDESSSFIEMAPNLGMKLANCICALKEEGVLGGIVKDEYGEGETFIRLHNYTWEVTRLIKSLDDFNMSKETYSDPDLYVEQLKDSFANSVNRKCF